MAIRIDLGPDGHCLAIVDGSMTIYEAAADKAVLLDALAKSVEAEIDLSSVREMDTAGLQILILAKRESLKAGKVLRLAGHSSASLDVVERYGLAGYFGNCVANDVGNGAGEPPADTLLVARPGKKRRRARAKRR